MTDAARRGPVLRISDLTIKAARASPGARPVVQNIGLDVHPGEVVALIGESGSGKTTIALSALGYLRGGLVCTRGQVLLNGVDMLRLDGPSLRALRGNTVSYVSQSAAASFNPGLQVGNQVIEPVLEHRLAGRAQASRRATALYRDLALPDPTQIGKRFPHEVSGGQLQRLMAAMAMGSGPALIVFDEPTTALDVTTQMSVLMSFKKIIREHHTAAIYVSHDLAVVAQIADRIIVLLNGEIQEQGPTGQIITAPNHPYTRTLIAACDPAARSPAAASSDLPPDKPVRVPILSVRGLTAGYGPVDAAGQPMVPAITGVSLTVHRGHFVGVIGESGSGKSTLARVIAGLKPRSAGQVLLNGVPLSPRLNGRSRNELRRLQIVFQAADTALNPRHTIGTVLGRAARHLLGLSASACRDRAADALATVQLPAAILDRLPQELSGGQKQRVNLARALIADPDLVICDEVTSALDAVVREQIIALLLDLKHRNGLSAIIISHDISTIAALAEDTLVMLRGQVVEAASTEEIIRAPQHDYSKMLIRSVPQLRVGWLEDALG